MLVIYCCRHRVRMFCEQPPAGYQNSPSLHSSSKLPIFCSYRTSKLEPRCQLSQRINSIHHTHKKPAQHSTPTPLPTTLRLDTIVIAHTPPPPFHQALPRRNNGR